MRTIVYLLSNNDFVYFVQPILRTTMTGLVFAVSVVVGRPLIARFAGDFCPLSADVSDRPGILRLFKRLTILWALVNALAAASSLVLLLTVPVSVFVVTAAVSAWIVTCTGVVVTVADSVTTARREGLITALSPDGTLYAATVHPPRHERTRARGRSAVLVDDRRSRSDPRRQRASAWSGSSSPPRWRRSCWPSSCTACAACRSPPATTACSPIARTAPRPRCAGRCWLFGAATFQNSAISWSADHRAHHADTDGPADPHAVTRGAWFAHVGWLFRRREASADVTRLRDLWALRSVRLQHRWYAVVAIGVGLVLPMAVAATWGDPWGGLFVAGFLRAGVMLQATFAINSLAHLVGTKRYDDRSSARDSLLTALVTFGEGYHSFHHRFPFDYRNGARWWQYDPSKWLIWTLRRVGLVNTVRSASPASIARAQLVASDGAPVYGHSPLRALRISRQRGSTKQWPAPSRTSSTAAGRWAAYQWPNAGGADRSSEPYQRRTGHTTSTSSTSGGVTCTAMSWASPPRPWATESTTPAAMASSAPGTASISARRVASAPSSTYSRASSRSHGHGATSGAEHRPDLGRGHLPRPARRRPGGRQSAASRIPGAA